MSKRNKAGKNRTNATYLKLHQEAFKTKAQETWTNIICEDVTDGTTFIQGLKNAGLKMIPGYMSNEDPNWVSVLFPTFEHAHLVMSALDGCRMEGKKVLVTIDSEGPPTSERQQIALASIGFIRRCVGDAFHERAFKDELGRGGFESAVAMQKVRENIKAGAEGSLSTNAEGRNAVKLSTAGNGKLKGQDHVMLNGKGRKIQSEFRAKKRKAQYLACEEEWSDGSSMDSPSPRPASGDVLSRLYSTIDGRETSPETDFEGFDD